MKKIDLMGNKYGRLTVIGVAESRRKPSGNLMRYWLCECDCGTKKEIAGEVLRYGKVITCGCGVKERISKLNYSHGMSNSREYKSWQHIKYRCLNKNSVKYPDYGGRGITICDRWINSFENFYADLGDAPSKNHTIDRIDVNGNYEPGNCRWADGRTQSNNQRKTQRLQFNGEFLTMSEIARKINIPYKYFWKLHKTNGLSIDEIIKRRNLNIE